MMQSSKKLTNDTDDAVIQEIDNNTDDAIIQEVDNETMMQSSKKSSMT